MFDTSLAVGKWPGILKALGMDESFLRDKHGPCPMCGGKDRYRFDDLDGKGSWYCNACGSGDGFSLLMKWRGETFAQAVKDVQEVVDAAQPTFQKSNQSDEQIRQSLRRAWSGAGRIKSGDEVDKYLAARRIQLDSYPASLRFHPAMDYYQERARLGTYAAMLALVSNANGDPISIHRTYLSGGCKANVPEPKKLMKSPAKVIGCAIRLYEPDDELGVAEGIETALKVHILQGLPMWATISTAGMESLVIPKGVKRLHIYGDNDKEFAGQKAAYVLAHRAAKSGIDVVVNIYNETGKDWADEL